MYNGKRGVISKNGLIGTPNHPVFTYENGFVRMDMLTQALNNDILSLGGAIKWRYQKLLYLMEMSTTLWEGKESIISVTKVTLKNGDIQKDFMWRFGNFTMRKKFLQAMKFTIKMGTLLITTLATWNVYRLGNTVKCINSKIKTNKLSILKMLENWLQNGTNRKKVENGTEKIQPKIYLIDRTRNMFVSFVVKSLKHKTRQDFVPIIATSNGDIETNAQYSKSNVLFVEKSLKPKAHTGTKTEARLVAESAGENLIGRIEKVYNLTVEKDHVYYANGLLVSNCSQALNRLMFAFVKKEKPVNAGKSFMTSAEAIDEGVISMEPRRAKMVNTW